VLLDGGIFAIEFVEGEGGGGRGGEESKGKVEV